jgi:hypothetical protein
MLQRKVGNHSAGFLYVTQCGCEVCADLVVALPKIGHEKRAEALIQELFTDLIRAEKKTAFKIEH